jgi:hypothetical protein
MSSERPRQLPVWIEDREKEHPEAEACRKLSLNERGERVAEVCRLAMAIMNSRPDADRAFAFQERLPRSSEQWLEHLRRRYHPGHA